MRIWKRSLTIFLMAAIISVSLLIGNTGKSYAISHLFDFKTGTVAETISEGGRLIKQLALIMEGAVVVKKIGDLIPFLPYGLIEDESGSGENSGDPVGSGMSAGTGGVSEEDGEEIPLTVEAEVKHTPDWEKNRGKYNSYAAKKGLDSRGEEKFWFGEVLVLSADVSGAEEEPEVTAEVKGTGYSVTLGGKGDAKTGEIVMKDIPGAENLKAIEIIFTAKSGEKTAVTSRRIVVDNSVPYWLLHRKEAPDS